MEESYARCTDPRSAIHGGSRRAQCSMGGRALVTSHEVSHTPAILRALEAGAVTCASLDRAFDNRLGDELALAAGYPVELRQIVRLRAPGVQRLTGVAIPAEAPGK